MKFVINKEDKKSIWFLTKDMVDSLSSANVSLNQLDNIQNLIGTLSPNEVANILVFQDIIANTFAVKGTSSTVTTDDEVNAALLQYALDNVNREDLKKTASQYNRFYVKGIVNGCVVVFANTETLSDFTPLKSTLVPQVVLEAVYTNFGYQDVHFNDLTLALNSEYTMAGILQTVALA